MHRLLTPVLLCLLVAGCRTPGKSYGTHAAKMGPSLERLTNRMLDPSATDVQRQANWQAVQGRLLRANGTLVSAGDAVVIECPPEKDRQVTVCVRAYPEERFRDALSSLKIGKSLGVIPEDREEPGRDRRALRVGARPTRRPLCGHLRGPQRAAHQPVGSGSPAKHAKDTPLKVKHFFRLVGGPAPKEYDA
jgi:hypothetical protein